ncbi:MAG: hypothetical protein Q8N76_06605 [Candidatus Omnitrophota bacterium]|nr:hypothetical protein [Candidatus Omnitrophota bacterium]
MISASKFYAILNKLKRKSLIAEHVINLGGRGGMSTFLEISKAGCEEISMPVKPHLTRGGNAITDVFVFKLSEHLKGVIPDCRISIEKEIQGKWIDLVLEFINQPFILGVELELCDANLKSNIEHGVERVEFLIEACISEQIMSKACEIVKGLPVEKQNKIAICLLTRLLKCQKLSEVVDSQILKERNL